jgi:hypothetical protein
MRAKIGVLILFVILAGPAKAQYPVCPGANQIATTTGSPEVRIVLASFPAHANPSLPCCECVDPIDNDNMPPWADAFAAGFEQYLAWVSNGRFTPNVEVIHHADPALAGRNWRALNPSTYYRNNCATGGSPHYGHLNAELIQRIHEEHAANGNPNVWTGVAAVLFINFESVWPHGGFIGIGNMGLPPTFNGAPYNFAADVGGATIMLGCWEIDDAAVPARVERAATHEFGHVLGLQHTPFTANISTSTDPYNPVVCGQPALDPQFVNVGRYGAIMRMAHPEPAPDPGLVAYHPMDLGASLASGATGWLPVTTIAPCPSYQTVRVADIRDPDPARGRIVKVTVPASDQYFLLVNHQGGGLDAKYGGSGLLVWHIWPNRAWDLESASGKTIAPPGMSGSPDPNTWWDALEADVCQMGAAGDFFDGSPGRRNFNPTTNPNTNLYSTTYQTQSVVSGLHFDNIRYDPGTTDILVDVAIAQFGIESPPAGARYAWGEEIRLDWAICGSVVDVLISDSTGSNSSFTLLEDNAPNDGSFRYVVPSGKPAGSNYKLRVIPDNNPNFGVDSPPFTIWTLSNLTATPRVKQPGTLRLDFRWNTSHTSNQNDAILLLTPSGQPPLYNFSRAPGGTLHAHSVSVPCQEGTWRYVVGSSHGYTGPPAGTSSVSSYVTYGQLLEVEVPSCSPPPGPCPPDCEIVGQAKRPGEDPTADGEGVPVYLQAVSNPFRNATALRFGLPQASHVDLVLHDVTGRVVRVLISSTLPAGQHHAHWDGLDAGGRRVPAGLYLAQLRTPEAVLTQKLIRVH